MTDNTAAVLALVAFCATTVAILCLLPHYGRSTGGVEHFKRSYKPLYWHGPGRIAPNDNIEAAPTRKPKRVPAPQPNRRKKKKAKNKR